MTHVATVFDGKVYRPTVYLEPRNERGAGSRAGVTGQWGPMPVTVDCDYEHDSATPNSPYAFAKADAAWGAA